MPRPAVRYLSVSAGWLTRRDQSRAHCRCGPGGLWEQVPRGESMGAQPELAHVCGHRAYLKGAGVEPASTIATTTVIVAAIRVLCIRGHSAQRCESFGTSGRCRQ
jgi:hypothetical protein